MALGFWAGLSSRMRRIYAIVLFFVLAVIVTIAGTLTPLTASEADSLNQDLDQMRESISVQYIFGNNMMVCLIMFVPVIGPLFGLYVLYNTGVVIGAESMASLHISPVLIFLSLFILPFTWLEFISYSIACVASIWLTWRLIQHKARRELTRTGSFIAICAVFLLIGAIVEYLLITGFQ